MAKSHWEVSTPDLIVRDFVLADITQGFVDGLNDHEHMRFSTQGGLRHTLSTQQAYVRSFDGTPHFLLAMVEKSAPNSVMGSMTVYFSEDMTSADLGIFVLPGMAGRGLGKQAWCAVSDHLASLGGLRGLSAGTQASNLTMQALMEAAGFKRERRDSACVPDVEAGGTLLYYFREFALDNELSSRRNS